MGRKVALYAAFFFGILLLFTTANGVSAEEMMITGQEGPGGTTSTGKMVTTYEIPVVQSVLEEPIILPAPGQPISHYISDEVPTGVQVGDYNPEIEQDVPVSKDLSSISLLGKLFLDVSGLFQGLFLWMG